MSHTAYEQMHEKVFEAIEQIGSEIDRVQWMNIDHYADLLAQIYYYVNHATRVLAFAALRTPIDDKDLHEVFLHGIAEEKNHEILAQDDLEHLGFSLNEYPENFLTSCYYQTLYYQIDLKGPIALLGYFIPLEAVGPLKISLHLPVLKKLYGENAIRFLDEHCLLDQDHYKEGLEFMKTRSEQEMNLVAELAGFSAKIFSSMLRDVRAKHDKEKQNDLVA